MYQYNQQQTSFRQGELGDGLSEQRHLKIFHNAVQVAQNCNINLQGNIYNRGGFRYLFDAPVTDNEWNYNTVVWSFRNSTYQIIRRAIIFSDNLATVYAVDADGAITPNPLCTFETHKTGVEMQVTHCAPIEKEGNHSLKALLFTNRKLKPFLLTFSNDAQLTSDFNVTDVTLANIPKHQFKRDDRTGITLGTGNLSIQQFNNQYNIVATNNAFTTGLCSDYKDLIVRINPMGELRVLGRVDDKTLACTLTKDLGVSTNIAPENFILELGWEPIASDTRGWFECAAVHDNRLYLANTRDLPNALIGSTTEFKLDFDLGSMQDDDACFTLMNTGLTDEIVNLVGGSTLHIFTKNQVFVLSTGGGIVTPTAFDTTKISQGSGSDTYTDAPQTQEGGVVYIDSSLEKMFYIAYDRNSESYSPNALNLILPEGLIHQFKGTYSFVLVNYGRDIGECGFFINRNLDIVRCVLTLEEDAIPCFTHYKFGDTVMPLKLFVIGKNLYCIFHDTHSDANYVAVYDDETFLDASYEIELDPDGNGQLPAAYPNWLEPYYLDRENGAFGQTVISVDREVNIPSSAGHRVYIGQPFEFLVVTNERNGVPQENPNLQGYKKHLSWIYVSIKEATKLLVGCSSNKDDTEFMYQKLCDTNYLHPVNHLERWGGFKGYYDEILLFFKQNVPGKIFIKSYTASIITSAPYS